MAGLLDIAPLTETVSVGGVDVPVYGVSAKGIAMLLAQFPELRMLMTGRDVEMDRLMAMGGDAVTAIIAAGIGFPGDVEQEAAAGRLGVEAQADLIAAILKLTMPGGVGPFVQKLAALGGMLNAEGGASPKGRGSNSPKPSKN